MNCQQLIIYGILLLIGLYLLKDVCGINFEGMTVNANDNTTNNSEVGNNSLYAGEDINKDNAQEVPLRVQGLSTDKTSCYPQNTLKPNDLLPKGQSDQIQDFENQFPDGEGYLKNVNMLDAGYHVGVNTIGNTLRNANLGLRSEPSNPRIKVSPWMNTTIAPDLSRKSLNGDICDSNIQSNQV